MADAVLALWTRLERIESGAGRQLPVLLGALYRQHPDQREMLPDVGEPGNVAVGNTTIVAGGVLPISFPVVMN